MKYDTKTQKHNLWNAEIEALIAILVLKLRDRTTNFDPLKECRYLNYKYLRKRLTGKIQNYGAIPMQRSIINESGY